MVVLRGDRSDMRLALVVVVVFAVIASGDVAHLRAKARWAGRLAGRHHKRGVLSAVPPFKLGYDIPQVTHSVVKPLVVNYPPAASVTAVKVPLSHPLVHRYPVPVGHKVPVPHPHYGLKFPHHKTFLHKPDHFHHHHHHVAPRPVPVPATPVVPVAQPAATVLRPIPVPSPPVFVQPAPVSPPLNVLPPQHTHLGPLPTSPIPLQPTPLVPTQYPVAHQYPYVIRPGNAIQTSLFATYPRYPFLNYPQLFPLTAPAAPTGQVYQNHHQAPHFHLGGHEVVQPASPTGQVYEHQAPHFHLGGHEVVQPTSPTGQVYLEHQVPHFHLGGHEVVQPTSPTGQVYLEHQAPHFHLGDQAPHFHLGGHEAVPTSAVAGPTPTLLHPTQAAPHIHLQPTQPVPLEHDGWAPVPAPPHDIAPTHTEAHFPQGSHFTQEQGTQVFEQHTDEQFHEYQHQLHNIQHQIDQAQYEQHLNNQHQLNQDYGAPQLNQEYGQPNPEFSQHGQEYAQHGEDYALHRQQLGQEYGVPQQEVEGRSSEAEADSQRYHNHIPLGLQPPIDRPLDHF